MSPLFAFFATHATRDEMKDFTIRIGTGLFFLCCTFFAAAQPVADFSYDAGTAFCNPITVAFTNLSSGDGELSYTWQFGVGESMDTMADPVFTYQECGTYEVILTVTDTSGATASDTQMVVIHCTPMAAFGFTQLSKCDSSNIFFTDNSTTADSITTWHWDFGDPLSGAANTSSLINPSHNYKKPGTFEVVLTVTTNEGCSTIATDSITIYQPVCLFSILDSACVNDTVFFIDQSYSFDSITQWSWNFDDPTSGANVSIKQNPFHIYHVADTFNVRLTVTSANGCVSILKKPVIVHGLPMVSAGSDVSICQKDSIQLQATGAVTYSWSPANFLNDAFVADPFAFPTSTQQFIVKGIDLNGCADMDTLLVNVLPLPEANAGNDSSICTGSSATLHGSGGESYLWFPAATLDADTIASPTASPLDTTQYILVATDANGCMAADTVQVNVVPLPVVTILGMHDQYCANGASVLLTANPAGGIFSGDGVTDTLFQPSTLPAGGPYAIIYNFTNATGCSGSDTAIFFIVAPVQVSLSISDSTLCLNQMPATVIANPSGGILTGIGIINDQFDPQMAGIGTHTIFYQLTDSNNCIADDSLEIIVFDLPQVDAGMDTFICAGDSIQLMVTGGLSYSWSPDSSLTDAFSESPIAFPPETTMYTVSTKDSNECANADSIQIAVLTATTANAGANVTICVGDSIQLSASGGLTYSWMPVFGLSDSTIDNPTAFPVETTMYTVTVNGSSACPGMDSVLITVNDLPIITAGDNQTVCAGDSIQLYASGGNIYHWQPNFSLSDSTSESPFAFPEVTTVYTLTGTADNGCSGHDSTIVVVLSLPIINAGNDTTICAGDSVRLQASGGETYKWMPSNFLIDDNTATPLAFPVFSTFFIATGTDASGCSATDTVAVIVFSVDLVDAGDDTSLCKGDSIMLHASGGISYSWYPQEGLSNPESESPFAFPLSTIVYTVTVVAGPDCFFSDTIKVTVNELPNIDAGTDTMVCSGDSIHLSASGGVTYHWEPAIWLSDSASSNPWSLPLDSIVYTVTGTDAYGCTNADSVSIVVLPLPVADAGIDTAVCSGDSIQLHATGGTIFLWQPASFLDNALIPNPVAFPLQTTNYVVATSADGICYNYDTVVVTVNPLPLVDAGADQTVCMGDTLPLNATGGLTYFWSPPTGLSSTDISNPTAVVNESVTYTVTVTDQNFCSAADSIHLQVVPDLIAMAGYDTTICLGSAANLYASGGSQYLWMPANVLNDPQSATPIAMPDETTTFTVFVSDGICYADTLQVKVIVSKVEVDAGADATIVSGTPYQLLATGSQGSYSWYPAEGLSCTDCQNPTAIPLAETSYTVTVTDSTGCEASDTVTLKTGCNAESVFIPNAFSPDNNGHNDVLYVRSTGVIEVLYFRVFDRWGKIIFEANDISQGWDGTYNGQVMPPGVYLYTLKARCGLDEIFERQGNVTLIK